MPYRVLTAGDLTNMAAKDGVLGIGAAWRKGTEYGLNMMEDEGFRLIEITSGALTKEPVYIFHKAE